MSGEKSPTVGLVVPRGKPKYVNGIVPIEQPKVIARCTTLSSVMLMDTRNDLLKFTFRPVESENGLSSPLRLNKVLASP